MQGVTLEGRTAVVTGAAGGLGQQICRDLAAIGARVIAADLDADGANAIAADLPGAVALAVDLSDPASIDAFVAHAKEAAGTVDVLVNNAGIDVVQPFVQNDPAIWDRLIAVNLRAPIHLTHGLLPAMLEQGWGRLLFVSSDAGRVGSSGEAVYSACKAGHTGFAKTIARESARKGVTSNVVCPGPMDTPMLRAVSDTNPKLTQALERAIPLGRLGQPYDIAGLVTFLCSERGGYMTGQVVSVSGGLSMS